MKNKPLFFAILIISLYSTIAFAEDSNSAVPKSNPFGFLSDIFYPKPSNLAKLIDNKKIKEADAYLTSEKQYFIDNKQEHMALLKKLATELNEIYEPRIREKQNNVLQCNNFSQEKWVELKETFESSGKLIEEYEEYEIFKDESFKSPILQSLKTALNDFRLKLKQHAPIAFQKFDHFSDSDFFKAYPTDQKETSFFEHNIELHQPYINDLTTKQVIDLKKKYGILITDSEKFNDLLSSRFISSMLAEEKPPYTVGKLLSLLKKTKEAGFNSKKIPNFKMAFVEVTSKTLLQEGQIEFPAQIEMDIPFSPIKAELDEIIDNNEKMDADYVVIFDVATARVNRRIISKKDEASNYVTGTRNTPNPDYEIARAKLYEAQAGLAQARMQYSPGLAGAIVQGIAIGMWTGRIQESQNLLTKTPTTLTENLFDTYKYSTSDVKTTKSMTTNYYIIDRATKQYYKGTFDISENKSFTIAYNVNDKDPNHDDIIRQYNKEEDLVSFEQSPTTVRVSDLMDDYLKNESKSIQLLSVTKLRDEILKDKNKALAAYRNTQFSAVPTNDPRFDSVVVILNPKGAMGTGFFVGPDMIMTNYHVIEGSKFVEMKLYNGMETFGKVAKSDVRLDLALIKVQTRGVPVKFFEGRMIDLGSTVEAIGHPKGLTYTITRGVVSAVRKKKSVFAVGGKDVTFVQTDAAINPGNSGGPLFLGDKLVGVNNNKLAGSSEGLGFAIHYSEVAEFLKESF